MKWQDAIFTVGSFFLLVTLIPMLRDPNKPPYSSSIPIAIILYVFTFTYMTLGFMLAPVIEFVQGTLWAWLAAQRWRSKPKRLWASYEELLGEDPFDPRKGLH